MPEHTRKRLLSTLGLALSGTAITLTLMGCGEDKPATQTEGSHSAGHAEAAAEQTHDIGGPGPEGKPINDPLVTHIYTADPSAHVFDGKLYIYPSHDVEAGIPQNDNGDHFDMRDYHVLSMEEPVW